MIAGGNAFKKVDVLRRESRLVPANAKPESLKMF